MAEHASKAPRNHAQLKKGRAESPDLAWSATKSLSLIRAAQCSRPELRQSCIRVASPSTFEVDIEDNRDRIL
jgi:hypothetical protein